MMAFELLEPASLMEAIALIDPDDPEVRPIAGGTALMLMMKAGVFRPRRLVSLRKLGREFSRIAVASAGELTIGAMAPLSALEHSPAVAQGASVIGRTMRRLSNVRVRNVATVGGALAHADPHMDLPPVLIALGATIAIAGPTGERTMAIEDLFTGYYETALAKNELITQLRIPAQGEARAVYFKVTSGSADDWPSLGLAVGRARGDFEIDRTRFALRRNAQLRDQLILGECRLVVAGKKVFNRQGALARGTGDCDGGAKRDQDGR